MRRPVLLLSLLLGSAVAGCAAWLTRELHMPFYGSPAAETFVEIPRGSAPYSIARLLAEAGIIRSRFPFLLYIRWSGSARHLQAGEYRFASPTTPEQVAQRLLRGDVYYISVTIPEGLTAEETVELIASQGLGKVEELEDALQRTDWIQDIDPGAHNLEGYLFPETYHFPHRVTSEEIVKAGVDEFKRRFARLTSTHPIPEGWDTHRIVTLASLIEKEVKNPSERGLVASVLVNRLEKGMPLACDPTIIYALKLSGEYDGNIRKADLGINSLYNTYLHTGLPPGPIANPGEESLKAALRPLKSEFLYYVSRNDGTHVFSRDFQSHLSAVAKFQKPLTPRHGGSSKRSR